MAALRKSPEDRAAKEEQKQHKAFRKAWDEFWASPAGEAREAFERGDHVFQYSIDVMNQQAIIVAMVGSTTSTNQADPTAVLNSVCHEGWELVNGDFVFLMHGQQSRDKSCPPGRTLLSEGR